jgi:hypothetical protein
MECSIFALQVFCMLRKFATLNFCLRTSHKHSHSRFHHSLDRAASAFPCARTKKNLACLIQLCNKPKKKKACLAVEQKKNFFNGDILERKKKILLLGLLFRFVFFHETPTCDGKGFASVFGIFRHDTEQRARANEIVGQKTAV